MNKKTAIPLLHIELTALWGNDDAESTIKISCSQWKKIQAGGKYEMSAWGWYEGSRFPVAWKFADETVTIDGEDGMQCVLGLSVSELIVEASSTEEPS